ncbi:peroxisomal leader peptide-processing protease [Thalassophryne amazonica]|uniref:peroxisomal leader peptide-processing protease n=1 Tax=Thalassophryne amazonica TaxID=390379 RepID=UPI001471BFA5|nr:peroxisomal leader peptide-processing protease [Thalassophryne amazonica]
MELQDVGRFCCVVTVSDSFSEPVSCSGVIVHPQTGTVICTALPFARFISQKEPLCANCSFLPPCTFSNRLHISVSFSAYRHLDTNRCAQEACTTPSPVQQHHREATARLLVLVDCLEFRHTLQTVFQESDQWRFHGDEELMEDAQFLSWFAVIQTDVTDNPPNSGVIPWQSSSCLRKGCPVVACGSPFGSLCVDLFISTLSRGIVSNLAGEDNTVILTDARCLPGTEGGGLFAFTGSDRVCLIGVVVSPFGWKANEWIGLTLVCSVDFIFRNVIRCETVQEPLRDMRLYPGETGIRSSAAHLEPLAVKFPTVCLVDSGLFWGSGVVVSSQLVLTCRHVVDGKSAVTLKFHHRDRFHDVVGDVLFSTKASSPYDLAVVQMKDSAPKVVVSPLARCFYPGEPVVVVGYGGLGQSCGPSLTCGILSKSITLNYQPVMLQTTCAVHAGTSGGAVVRTHSGELLGIVSSNTRDFAAKVTYPHLNFSIPVTVFHELLEHFNHTRDVGVFTVLDTTEEDTRRVWRLQNTQSKL